MIKNYPLYFSKTFSDNFSFSLNLTDEFYNSLINEKSLSINLKVKDNNALFNNGNKSFSAIIDYQSSFNHVVQQNQSHYSYEIYCVNNGNITVTIPESISSNRKRYISQNSDSDHAPKRQSIDQNIKILSYKNHQKSNIDKDEQRIHSQPHRSAATVNNNSDAFNVFKSEKITKEVPNLCGISENKFTKSERIQGHPNELLKKSRQSVTTTRKSPIKVNATTVNNKSSKLETKWRPPVNFDVYNNAKNGNLCDEKIFNNVFSTIQYKRDKNKDFNNNIFPKPNPNNSKVKAQHKLDITPKKPEIKTTTIIPIVKNNSITKPMKSVNRNSVTTNSYKSVNEHINKVNPLKMSSDTPKKEVKPFLDVSESVTSSHYPTEPYLKTQDETITTSKAATEPKLIPRKVEFTQFIYKVVNPSTSEFKPNKHPIRQLMNTDTDSEEFLNDVSATYDRFQMCRKVYMLYNDRLASLKERAQKCTKKEEWEGLYKDSFHLIEEEKQSFFIDLENEATILQDKLIEISKKMGLKVE